MQRNENKMPNGAKCLWPSSEKGNVWKMRLNSREMAGKKSREEMTKKKEHIVNLERWAYGPFFSSTFMQQGIQREYYILRFS